MWGQPTSAGTKNDAASGTKYRASSAAMSIATASRHSPLGHCPDHQWHLSSGTKWHRGRSHQWLPTTSDSTVSGARGDRKYQSWLEGTPSMRRPLPRTAQRRHSARRARNSQGATDVTDHTLRANSEFSYHYCAFTCLRGSRRTGSPSGSGPYYPRRWLPGSRRRLPAISSRPTPSRPTAVPTSRLVSPVGAGAGQHLGRVALLDREHRGHRGDDLVRRLLRGLHGLHGTRVEDVHRDRLPGVALDLVDDLNVT